MREQSPAAAWEVFVNSLTARLLDFSTFRRNKPGMSMKTKDCCGKTLLSLAAVVGRVPACQSTTPNASLTKHGNERG